MSFIVDAVIGEIEKINKQIKKKKKTLQTFKELLESDNFWIIMHMMCKLVTLQLFLNDDRMTLVSFLNLLPLESQGNYIFNVKKTPEISKYFYHKIIIVMLLILSFSDNCKNIKKILM